jgi:hypothetical protein
MFDAVCSNMPPALIAMIGTLKHTLGTLMDTDEQLHGLKDGRKEGRLIEAHVFLIRRLSVQDCLFVLTAMNTLADLTQTQTSGPLQFYRLPPNYTLKDALASGIRYAFRVQHGGSQVAYDPMTGLSALGPGPR